MTKHFWGVSRAINLPHLAPKEVMTCHSDVYSPSLTYNTYMSHDKQPTWAAMWMSTICLLTYFHDKGHCTFCYVFSHYKMSLAFESVHPSIYATSFTLCGHDLARCVALKLMYARGCNLRFETNETCLKNDSKCFQTLRNTQISCQKK